MSSPSMRIPGLAEASVNDKLAMIDELREAVRRSGQIQVRADHLAELEKRVVAVMAEPDIALSPAQARALLKK